MTNLRNTWKYERIKDETNCMQLVGKSDDDITNCRQPSYVLVGTPSGKSSTYCLQHAFERLLAFNFTLQEILEHSSIKLALTY